MSMELHDVGSVKLTERDYAYLEAEAEGLGTNVVTLVRQIVHEHVQKKFSTMSVAASKYTRKGFGDIFKDSQ